MSHCSRVKDSFVRHGLLGGVDKLDLDPWAKVDPVTQPIGRNAMRLAETCLVVGDPAFDDLLDHFVVVFENKQTCLMAENSVRVEERRQSSHLSDLFLTFYAS